MATYASDLIKVAINELGYQEKKSQSNLYNKTANAGSANYNKYSYELDTKYPNLLNGKKDGYAWCACFVLWCNITAFGYDKAKTMLSLPDKSAAAGVTYLYAYMKKANKVGKEPKLGAIIIFGTKENDLKHTGIIESFDSTYVNTIEGNTSNMVARRKYKRNDSNIFGYCYPPFDGVNNPNNKTSTSNTNSYSVSNINIPINKNEKNLNKSSKSKGIVNTGELNVRTWAGAENPQLKSAPTIKKDTIIDVCDAIAANNKDKWYYILINNKTYGFVNSKYITLIDNKVDTFSYENTR